jgi:dienelactone hydrolase
MPTMSGMVLFRTDSANLNAYLTYSEGEGPFPGVVIITRHLA